MTAIPAAGRGPHFVPQVTQAFCVLRAFDAVHPALTLADVAARSGLAPADAQELLLALTDLGYVRCVEERYSLTPRTLELGFAYLSTLGLPQVAQPHLQALTYTLGETSTLSVMDGDDVFHLAGYPGFRRPAPVVGARGSAWSTAAGSVLLAALSDDELARRLLAHPEHAGLRAHLEQVRARGWAWVDGGVAAPVRDRRCQVVAAIEVSVRTSVTPAIVRYEQVPELLRAAQATEADWARRGE